MRYDEIVYFCKEPQQVYDPKTGDYEEAEPVKDDRYASVQDTGADMLKLVYGKIRQGSLTIQLQNHYDEMYDYIEYRGVRYNVDMTRRLRVKQVFVVSEAQ